MRPNSLQTREILFAYFMMPPRFLSRIDASALHNEVCEALSYDDLVFTYRPLDSIQTSPDPGGGSSSGFATTFERREGRGAFRLLLENKTVREPLRLLISHVWPTASLDIFDISADTVSRNLPDNTQRVLAEVRIRAQCSTTSSSGINYLLEHVLRFTDEQKDSFGGNLNFASTKIEIPGASPTEDDQLANPKREMTLEVLREDPSRLYIELMSQWTQVPSSVRPGGQIDLSSLRRITEPPRSYIQDAQGYLDRVLQSFP